ncbi:RNase H domain-containing protein [Hirsutella rhossiliensis]|uniref:RNase H domain-containing protein n=1 Tax=Hirsutella rhossiliensis TaxID=111463 RepID=A0A9P8SHF6_9HYPO|nr:RNase H domain-containing protein [Hirsutella rhossiliensis]KAH0962119.1 RNase H domain-containing protein [Hirsutella rhossiliensis]
MGCAKSLEERRPKIGETNKTKTGTPDQQWPIVVCLDNTAAIRAIRGSPSISSQAAAEKFAEAAARHGDVSTRWCPGHTGIAGNERADQLAKEGCRAEGPDRSPTYANIKRQAKAAARRDFQDCKHQKADFGEFVSSGKLVSNNGMPRAASPSAASRHRLLLPPLLAGLDFCRLAAPTSSAASRPDFFSPFLARLALPRTLCRLYWLASPSAALRLCLLLPSRGSELCRLAALSAAQRPRLPLDWWAAGP